MKNKLIISFTLLVALALATNLVQAGIFGAGLGGALRGAIVGNLVDGRDGAAAGAVIGGLIGAGEAASREKKERQRTEAAQKRQAEWQATQQAEQQRIQKQRAVAVPQNSTNQTLVIETQKSLIRLGYEPGDIGDAGPALAGAVKEYQKSKGLLETGELSQPLLTHMLRNGG
jgi:outer membrane lipoprotein SlyB